MPPENQSIKCFFYTTSNFILHLYISSICAYTSYQVLSANNFQGEQITCSTLGTDIFHKMKDSAVLRTVVSCASACVCTARMGNLVSGTRTKELCIKEEKAQLCNWNPLGLRNIHWPSSSKQELKEPARSPHLYLFNPKSCVLGKDWTGWVSANVKIPGIYTAPKLSWTVMQKIVL